MVTKRIILFTLILFVGLPGISDAKSGVNLGDCSGEISQGDTDLRWFADYNSAQDDLSQSQEDIKDCSELNCYEKIAKTIILGKIKRSKPSSNKEFLQLLEKKMESYRPALKETERKKIISSIISERLAQSFNPEAQLILYKHLSFMRTTNRETEYDRRLFILKRQQLTQTIENRKKECTKGMLSEAQCFLTMSKNELHPYAQKIGERIKKGTATKKERVQYLFIEGLLHKTMDYEKSEIEKSVDEFAVAAKRYRNKVNDQIKYSNLSDDDKIIYREEFNQQMINTGLELTNKTNNLLTTLNKGQAELQLAAKTLGVIGVGVAAGGIGLKLLSSSSTIAAGHAGSILTKLGMAESSLGTLVGTKSMQGLASAAAIEGVTFSWITNLFKKGSSALSKGENVENAYCSIISSEINDKGFLSEIAMDAILSAGLGGAAGAESILIKGLATLTGIGIMGVGTATIAYDIKDNLSSIEKLKSHTDSNGKECLEKAKEQVVKNGIIDVAALALEIGVSVAPGVLLKSSKGESSAKIEESPAKVESTITVGQRDNHGAQAPSHEVQRPKYSRKENDQYRAGLVEIFGEQINFLTNNQIETLRNMEESGYSLAEAFGHLENQRKILEDESDKGFASFKESKSYLEEEYFFELEEINFPEVDPEEKLSSEIEKTDINSPDDLKGEAITLKGKKDTVSEASSEIKLKKIYDEHYPSLKKLMKDDNVNNMIVQLEQKINTLEFSDIQRERMRAKLIEKIKDC